MKKSIFAFIFFAIFLMPEFLLSQANAYDTLKVMTYNVLNYGFPATQDCPALLTDSKSAWLRTIVQYADPDILGLEKMDATPASFTTDTVIQDVLNQVCNGCYANTPYTNISGYYKENMLYYKTQKIGWINTTTIYSGDSNISDINLHRLYYKSPTLALTHDTIFLNIILVHLASGSGSAEERAVEMTGAMNWLNSSIISPGNYIFMGDFNTQSSGESCFQQIINSAEPNTLFFDPVNQLGNWTDDPNSFANFLTQSTRTTDPGDCGSTDGMENRFDHILCTKYLMDGVDSLQYMDGSFTIIGQDGLHTNNALTDAPANVSVPANVLNALYYMSEHLPVTLSLGVGSPDASAIASTTNSRFSDWIFNSLVNDQLQIKYKGNETGTYNATIYDMEGRLISNTRINTGQRNILQVSNMPDGIYVLRISRNDAQPVNGKFIEVNGAY